MIELNKIYCENCLDTMARIPDNFIDLTVTSPPYDDMDEDFNPIQKRGSQKVGMRDYNGYSWDFKKIAQELFRVTKIGGVVVWVVNDPTIKGSESLASSLQKIYFRRCGFNIHDTMIDHNEGLTLNHNRYEQEFEYMFILSKSKPKTFNGITESCITFGRAYPGGRTRQGGNTLRSHNTQSLINPEKLRGNVWFIDTGFMRTTNDVITYDHPAIFPEKLARDHIYSWSNEGDLIYDPFMGSGTVAKMAHIMKRNWIGSEISQEYVDLANKRIDPYLRQQALAL